VDVVAVETVGNWDLVEVNPFDQAGAVVELVQAVRSPSVV
jgi:hypothetical protein